MFQSKKIASIKTVYKSNQKEFSKVITFLKPPPPDGQYGHELVMLTWLQDLFILRKVLNPTQYYSYIATSAMAEGKAITFLAVMQVTTAISTSEGIIGLATGILCYWKLLISRLIL